MDSGANEAPSSRRPPPLQSEKSQWWGYRTIRILHLTSREHESSDRREVDTDALLTPRGAKRISRTTLADQLEQALRADILEGVFPPGERLKAAELTERYGVSATPLREALQRLAGESLVDLDSRLGASVSAISRDDLLDTYELLTLLGCAALERSVGHGGADWREHVQLRFSAMVGAMKAQEDALDAAERRNLSADATVAHWEYHDALYQACGSPWLLRFVKLLHGHAERYRRRWMQASTAQRDLKHEHESILVAVLSNDSVAAVNALQAHLSRTVELLTDTFGGTLPDQDTQPTHPV